jgi:hypothetical protein
MGKKGNGAEVRTMSYTRDVHFRMFEGDSAAINVDTPGGISRIVIRNLNGRTEVHVVGNGDFIYSGSKDFAGDKGADYFISNKK